MRFLVLGGCGMIGHAVSLCLEEAGHEVMGYGDGDLVDADDLSGFPYDFSQLENVVSRGDYDAVVNCTAVINDSAENDKPKAVLINSMLPHLLERAAKDSPTIVVHRSTDCIFSGVRGSYDIGDLPDATSFYARSKALGEIVNDKDITIRTSLIGPELDPKGTGLFNWFMNGGACVNGYANAIWTGITTMEFAREIEELVKQRAHGLFQCVPDRSISKLELLQLFASHAMGDKEVVEVQNKRVDKSLVPCTGEWDLGIPGYEQMIADMFAWICSHKALYPHYFAKEKING